MVKKTENRKASEKSSTKIRLNKFLADCGVASRRKADELIKEGRVKVNGMVVDKLGAVIEISDKVTVDGNPVSPAKRLVYIVLNKPKDCICTAKDEKNRRTIFDIVKSRYKIFSVGRLDRNTTGCLLLTNDGELANKLMHPRYMIEKVYKAELDRALNVSDAQKIAKGIMIEEGVRASADVIIDPKDNKKVVLVLREGKNREIHRIFEALGYIVKKLDRKIFAGISTKGLKRGEYRHLTKQEVNFLKKLVEL